MWRGRGRCAPSPNTSWGFLAGEGFNAVNWPWVDGRMYSTQFAKPSYNVEFVGQKYFNSPQYYSLFSFQKAKIQGAGTKIKTKRVLLLHCWISTTKVPDSKEILNSFSSFLKLKSGLRQPFFRKFCTYNFDTIGFRIRKNTFIRSFCIGTCGITYWTIYCLNFVVYLYTCSTCYTVYWPRASFRTQWQTNIYFPSPTPLPVEFDT